MMHAKLITIISLSVATAMARPGALDRTFDPEMRTVIPSSFATLAPDGRVWIGGEFDRGDGWTTGDLLRLGANGGVESEPAQGHIRKTTGIAFAYGFNHSVSLIFKQKGDPFLLKNGDFLLSGESGGWLRMNSNGEAVGTAFPDRSTDESITPQFERESTLWTIRTKGNGARVLEKRNSTDGTLDPAFPTNGDPLSDASSAVPAPDGGVWLLSGSVGSRFPTTTPASTQRVLRLNLAGEVIGSPILLGARPASLVAGPQGTFRVVLGDDPSRWMFWPSPESTSSRVLWYSPTGVLLRQQDFHLPIGQPFIWAEAADGSFVAHEFPRSNRAVFIGRHGKAILQRFSAAGAVDPSFRSPGAVSSVIALESGKWLIDGTRRLNADGTDDNSWRAPHLTKPAAVSFLAKLPDGRILAGGNFESADGETRNRLAAFHPDGSLDASFVPDARLGSLRTLTVSGNAIYVVTENALTYGQGLVSRMVKLRLDGSLDETYIPRAGEVFPALVVPDVAELHAVGSQDILAVTRSFSGLVSESIQRYKPDGSRDVGFKSVTAFGNIGKLLTLSNGGFVRNGVFYNPDGTVARDISIDQTGLIPLCETPSGVLFLESKTIGQARLRLWTGRNWATWFRGPELKGYSDVRATPGAAGRIYLVADFRNRGPALLRLLSSGSIDRTFRSPRFGDRLRQHPGDWWIAEETGKITFDPAQHENPLPPQALLWEPRSRSLWTGGAFNTVDRQPRDGLARINGTFSSFR